MLWVYVLLVTAGLVAIVPTVMRAIDGLPANLALGFVGFAGTFGGLAGLFCRQVGVGGWLTLLASALLGLGAAALHPELLSMLKRSEEAEHSRHANS